MKVISLLPEGENQYKSLIANLIDFIDDSTLFTNYIDEIVD